MKYESLAYFLGVLRENLFRKMGFQYHQYDDLWHSMLIAELSTNIEIKVETKEVQIVSFKFP